MTITVTTTVPVQSDLQVERCSLRTVTRGVTQRAFAKSPGAAEPYQPYADEHDYREVHEGHEVIQGLRT